MMNPQPIAQEDGLGLLDAQLDMVEAAALALLPVPGQIAHLRLNAGQFNEAGGVDLRSFTGDKLERLAAYRFSCCDAMAFKDLDCS